MEFSDKLKELMGTYVEDVKERVTHPLQTLATALEEGMPTEQNPTGFLGAAGIVGAGKKVIGEVAKVGETQFGKFKWHDGREFKQQPDGSWSDGNKVYEDTNIGGLIDILRKEAPLKGSSEVPLMNVEPTPAVFRKQR